MTWPDYPHNRLIVGGVDITVRFQMILIDGYKLDPPEPKTYTVDVPGGDGVIDLTESIMGDVAYKQRQQEFTFILVDMQNEETFEQRKTQVANFLHGKSFDYQMTMDPGYTYHGRFSVSEQKHSAFPSGILGTIVVKVAADPYKMYKHMVYNLNGTGGQMFHLIGGRKAVYPIIQTAQNVEVRSGDTVVHVSPGTFRINDFLIHEGVNDIYVNSYQLYTVRWEELDQNGQLESTWISLSKQRWDDVARKNAYDNTSMTNAIEMLNNPNFDTGTTIGWAVDGVAEVQEHRVPIVGVAHSGNYELKVSDGGKVTQHITGLIPGKVLYIGVWIYSQSNSFKGSFDVVLGTVSYHIGTVSNVNTWKRVFAHYSIPDGVTSADIILSSVGGDSYFDDVTAKQVTQTSRAWNDLNRQTWDSISDTRWRELNYQLEEVPDTFVTISYDRKDL